MDRRARTDRAARLHHADSGWKTFTYTPGEMSDLSKLDYTYDDVSPPGIGPSPLVARMDFRR